MISKAFGVNLSRLKPEAVEPKNLVKTTTLEGLIDVISAEKIENSLKKKKLPDTAQKK